MSVIHRYRSCHSYTVYMSIPTKWTPSFSQSEPLVPTSGPCRSHKADHAVPTVWYQFGTVVASSTSRILSRRSWPLLGRITSVQTVISASGHHPADSWWNIPVGGAYPLVEHTDLVSTAKLHHHLRRGPNTWLGSASLFNVAGLGVVRVPDFDPCSRWHHFTRRLRRSLINRRLS